MVVPVNASRIFIMLPVILAACTRAATPAPTCPACPVTAASSDLVVMTSAHDHAGTVSRAVAAIEARGLVVVSRIDHAAAAQGVGLALDPATVIVFGNPKAGTPLMQVAPTIALDLPLRLLVWQRDGSVRVAYHAPAAVAASHGAKDHPVVGKLTEALAAISDAATKQ
jgi:uncharacterized protein (DUF302 family)